MKDIIINPVVNQFRSQKEPSVAFRAQTRANGDVELVNSNLNGDSVIGIIPRNKRAELAQFLVSAS